MQNYKGIMLYTFILVPSFMKISMTVLKLYSGHNFPVKDSKGPNSAKKCRWSYADCLILFYISTMFHENILNAIRVMKQTRTMGHCQTDRQSLNIL